MKFKNDEQEFAIITNAADKTATIHITGYNKYFKKLERLAVKSPETYKLVSEDKDEDGEVSYRKYTAPEKYAISLRCPKARTTEQIERDKLKGQMMTEKRKASIGKDK